MKFNYSIYLYLVPVLFILMIAEIVHLIKEERYDTKDLLCSVGLAIVAQLIYYFFIGAIIFSYYFIYEFRIFSLSESLWLTWVVCFFADDFTYYWFHRSSHKVRFLWASHIVHHSSEMFTLSASLRVPWTSNLTGVFLFWAWMPFIGINPVMVIFIKSFSVLYQFIVHTETVKKLPYFIEAIFITPSHHRVHHSSNVEYLDKNYGAILIIWDKIFGTYKEEKHKPVYGLTLNIGSYNPVTVATHEWKKIFNDFKKSNSLKNKFHYLFNPPGWRPDENSKTAKQLQMKIEKSPGHRA